MINKEKWEKERVLGNVILAYPKENKCEKILNFIFFALYKRDKLITTWSKNKDL